MISFVTDGLSRDEAVRLRSELIALSQTPGWRLLTAAIRLEATRLRQIGLMRPHDMEEVWNVAKRLENAKVLDQVPEALEGAIADLGKQIEKGTRK